MEKFGSLNKPKSLIEKAKAHTREIGVAAMIGLAPMHAEKIEAAEGLDGMNWQEGSQLFLIKHRLVRVRSGVCM